jgi:T3SS (YopN, CesT) and YbjN peptide-binding chaperone 1
MASDVVASTIDLARLALQAHEIGYDVEAGDCLGIDYGSARLTIVVRRIGESSVMRVSACVVDAVAVSGDGEFRLLRSLNERNRTLPYGKFFFDPVAGEIHVEYELLGDDLQDSEFMNALTTVARLAEDHDDVLVGELGHGRRAADRK